MLHGDNCIYLLKIQYPELEEQLAGDIKAIDTILNIVMWVRVIIYSTHSKDVSRI